MRPLLSQDPFRGWKDPVHPANALCWAPPPLLWLKEAFIRQRELLFSRQCLVTPPADLLPAQIKALVVPVALGGPSWGHGFSEVFWNVAQESQAPFWGPWRPRFNNLWGTLRFPSPTWQGWGHRPTQGQDGAANDLAEPPQARKRVGPPDITSFHRPLRSLSGKKGGSRPILGLAARRLSAHKGLQAPPQMPAPPGKAEEDQSWSLINKEKQR